MIENILSRPLIFLTLLLSLIMYIDNSFNDIIFGVFGFACFLIFLGWLRYRSIPTLVLLTLFLFLTVFSFRKISHFEILHNNPGPKTIDQVELSFKLKEIETTKLGYNYIVAFNFSSQYYQAILRSSKLIDSVFPGFQIIAKIKLNRNIPVENYEDFNYTEYLDHNHIQYTGYLTETTICEIKPNYNILTFAYLINNKLQSIIENSVESSVSAALTNGILLGAKGKIPEKISKQFIDSGTAHILTVSGMHLGIIYGSIRYLFNSLRGNKKSSATTSGLLTVLLIWVFTFITGLGTSVIRAAVMFSLLELGTKLKRNIDPLNILFGAAFILLLINPCILFDIGFQLSFTAVLSIIIFYPLLSQHFLTSIKAINYFTDIAKISISVQILILPVTIYYFHSVPVYFIFSNLIWVPLSTIQMFLGTVLLCVDYLSHSASFYISWTIESFYTLGLSVFDLLERMSYYKLSNIYINWQQTLLLILSIILVSIWIKYKSNRYLITSILCTALVQIIPLAITQFNSNRNEMVIYRNSNYALLSIKFQNQIANMIDNLPKNPSWFDAKFPLLPSNSYLYPDTKNLHLISGLNSIQVCIDTLINSKTDILIIYKMKLDKNGLVNHKINKIILHPRSDHSIRSYYLHSDFSCIPIYYNKNNFKLIL